MRAPRPSLVLLLLVAASVLSACDRDNPANCRTDSECPGGRCVEYRCKTIDADEGTDGGGADTRTAMTDGPETQDRPSVGDRVAPDTSPDGPMGDAGGTCSVDGECPSAAPLCLAGRCAKCTSNSNCSGRSGNVCEPSSGRCVQCAAATDCSDPTKPLCVMNICAGCGAGPGDGCMKRDPAKPACDSSGSCVQCTTFATCSDPAKPVCVANQCVGCGAMGAAPESCSKRNAALGFCESTSGACVECLTSANCTDQKKPICSGNKCVGCGTAAVGADACSKRNPKLPACDAGSGQCVECTTSADCSSDPTKPICQAQKCVPCDSDEQCAAKGGPGVCMFHQDGRCASDAETVYVQNKAGCSAGGPGGGTAAAPYCQSQAGVDAAQSTAGKRLVLFRGPQALLGFSVSSGASQLTVVAQGADVAPGAATGLRVSSGDLYVRGLKVRNSEDIGVVAEGGSTLRLDRCVIEKNKKGGILVNSAGFEIVNTVISGNGPNDQPYLWGGMAIVSVAPGKPKTFKNNTVVGNEISGIHCGEPLVITGSIFFNTGVPKSGLCTINECCSGDPLLSATYRLQAGSPCIDKLDAMMSVPDDLDGEKRPIGAKSDCGADEFKP